MGERMKETAPGLRTQFYFVKPQFKMHFGTESVSIFPKPETDEFGIAAVQPNTFPTPGSVQKHRNRC